MQMLYAAEPLLQPVQGEQLSSFSCGCFAFGSVHSPCYHRNTAAMFLLQTHSFQMWYCLEKSWASQEVIVLAFYCLSGKG